MESRREWLVWRKQGLGASDIPIVMGRSRFKTPLELYEDKISDEINEETNFITEKGNRLEPKIRALLELLLGKSFEPALCVMSDFPFMRASLDGRTEDKTHIAEFKFLTVVDPSKKLNEKAEGYVKWLKVKDGIVPEEYIDQVQTQLLISGAKSCYFVGLKEIKGQKEITIDQLSICEVFPDRERQAMILATADDFWNNHVMKRKPPIASKDDVVELKGINQDKVKLYKEIKSNIKHLTEELEKIESEIKDLAKKSGKSKLSCYGLEISQVSRVGNVDYKKVKELQGVDLEPYRGKGSTYYTIKIKG